MKQIFGGVVFLLVGCGLLYLADLQRQEIEELLDVGITTTATVVSVHTHESDDDDGGSTTMYAPEFGFRDQNGNSRKVRQHYSSGGGSSYGYGEQVQLLYHPTKPGVGRVKTFWQLHGLPLIIGFFGGIFFLAGLGALTWTVRVR